MIKPTSKFRPELADLDSKEILNELGAGLSLIDNNLRIKWMNTSYEKWFGSLESNFKRPCYETFQKRHEACPNCPAIKALRDGKIHKIIKTAVTNNKIRKCFLLTVTPIKDKNGQVIQLLELIQDITQSRKKERKSKQLISKFKRICKCLIGANNRLKLNIIALKKSNKYTDKLNNILKKKFKTKTSELEFAKQEIQDIYQINKTLSNSMDLKRALNLIVRLSRKITGANAACLKLIKPSNNNALFTAASVGLSQNYLLNTPEKIGEGVSGIAAATQRPIVITDISNDPRVKYLNLTQGEGIYSMISVPVLFNQEMLGVIDVYFKYPKKVMKDEMVLLKTFATQAALAIEETKLYENVHLSYFNTIHALVLAMEARDPYTKCHSERVTQYSLRIAKSLELNQKELEILTFASKVHDVGKIAISDTVLNKPGKLTAAERALVELHPVKGAEMLMPLSFLSKGIPCVRHHHERYDGNGYPDGIEKERIPILARIVACADAYDAMTSDRPYRFRKLTLDEAIKELELNSGKQFDPQVVNVFIKILKES